MRMKRLTVSLLMLIAISAQGFAADLLGKWKTVIEDEGTSIPCVMTITKTDLLFTVNMKEDDEEMGTISASINVPGTYIRQGDKMKVNLKKEDISIKLEEFKPKDEELKKMMDESPETRESLIAMVEGVIGVYKNQLADESFIDGELTIKSITSTTLTLADDDGTEIVFTRVK